jgi:multidrug efflux pump
VIPLSTVTKAQATTTPLVLNHTSSFPSVTVSFNLATGYVHERRNARGSEMQQRLEHAGNGARLFCRDRGGLSNLAGQRTYSYWPRPCLRFTSFSAFCMRAWCIRSPSSPRLPSASVGAMLALMLFKIDLNVISIIGIILLIGIVKKNAIMMIDFALVAEREHGKTTTDAIFEACQLRFRPILMTTMAALFGALPLAFGTGTGSELRRPLGITIVGGLIVSQMLTLYTTPVVYLFFDRMRLRFQGRKRVVLNHGTAEAS